MTYDFNLAVYDECEEFNCNVLIIHMSVPFEN